MPPTEIWSFYSKKPMQFIYVIFKKYGQHKKCTKWINKSNKTQIFSLSKFSPEGLDHLNSHHRHLKYLPDQHFRQPLTGRGDNEIRIRNTDSRFACIFKTVTGAKF